MAGGINNAIRLSRNSALYASSNRPARMDDNATKVDDFIRRRRVGARLRTNAAAWHRCIWNGIRRMVACRFRNDCFLRPGGQSFWRRAREGGSIAPDSDQQPAGLNMKRMMLCALIALSCPQSGITEDSAAACLASAFNAHLEAKTKLFETAGPVMNPEAQITRRRLDEKYCLAFTICGLRDQLGDARDMMASALFSSCLSREAS